MKKQLNHSFLTVSAKLCWVYCLLFRILFKDFLTFVFRQIFLLKKKQQFLPLKHGWMIFHPTTSFLRSEREWDGKERTLETRFVHPNPWKFWNFLTCHYIFPLRIAGLIFFCLWAHTRICTETTWQWLRVARVVFPVRVLFIFGGLCKSFAIAAFEIYAWNLEDIYCFICSYSSG